MQEGRRAWQRNRVGSVEGKKGEDERAGEKMAQAGNGAGIGIKEKGGNKGRALRSVILIGHVSYLMFYLWFAHFRYKCEKRIRLKVSKYE